MKRNAGVSKVVTGVLARVVRNVLEDDLLSAKETMS